MPTTSAVLDKERTPLTKAEEELLERIQSRLQAYFQDFEELEGFSLLSTNLHRLYRKVSLELRCVCYEYHDMYLLLDAFRAENAKQEAEMRRRQALCNQVIAETEALMSRCEQLKQEHKKEITNLHVFYSTQEHLREKQLRLESETRLGEHITALKQEHSTQVQALHTEFESQFETAKRHMESKKNAELEYLQVQMRLQITSQVSRDLGKQLARQEKLNAKQVEEIKQLQRRIHMLQEALRSKTRNPER